MLPLYFVIEGVFGGWARGYIDAQIDAQKATERGGRVFVNNLLSVLTAFLWPLVFVAAVFLTGKHATGKNAH